AASWAIDASEGFAALAWLGRALDLSFGAQLAPLERGTLVLASVAFLAVVTALAVALACVGARFDLPRVRRASLALGVLLLGAVSLSAASRIRARWDLTASRRASLPPASVVAL